MYYHIDNINETRTLKSVSGQLFRIIINKKGLISGTITIYDGMTESDPIIADISTNEANRYLEYNIDFQNGFTYKTTGTPGDITVIYQ